MPRVRQTPAAAPPAKRPPATTPEGREAQLVALATDLVEKRLRNGTATAAEVVHILKLGSEKEKLERAKLAREETLLAAKVEDLATAKRVEHVYEEALSAMRAYQGQSEDYDDDYYQVMY